MFDMIRISRTFAKRFIGKGGEFFVVCLGGQASRGSGMIFAILQKESIRTLLFLTKGPLHLY